MQLVHPVQPQLFACLASTHLITLHRLPPHLQGKRVVAVTSGANMNFERLRLVSELADLGASREVMMATTIPERPGAFSEFVDAAIGGSTMNVTEFKYRYSAGPHASILWSAGVKVRDEVTQAMARLEAAGMPTIDISNMANAQVCATTAMHWGSRWAVVWGASYCVNHACDKMYRGVAVLCRLPAGMVCSGQLWLLGWHEVPEGTTTSPTCLTLQLSPSPLFLHPPYPPGHHLPTSQVHLRHLVGGRARSYMGEIPNERIWQVSFPERPGALRRFLDTINPQWNVTLFHYRNTGNRESSVLLGLQVPPEQERMLMKAGRRLENDEFSFEELTDEERRVFNMFIQ